MKFGWETFREQGRWKIAVPTLLLVLASVAAIVYFDRDQDPDLFAKARLAEVRIPGPCDGGATKPFTPATIDIEDVADDLPVQPLARDGEDIPGVPPVNATHTVAFDAPGPKPGDEAGGLVRLNAHTWPNGAALGNAMLARFDVGDVLTLRNGDQKVCYRVTERVEVDGYSTYDPFYALEGPAKFAFIVCSGERRGPGDWSKRTIWFGTPIGDVDAKPTLTALNQR